MRKMVMPKAMIFLSLSILLGAHTTWADVRYEQSISTEFTVAQGKKLTEVKHQTVSVQGKKMRIEEKESGNVRLVRFDRGVLYNLDAKNSIYTEKDLQSLVGQKQQAMKTSEQMTPQRNKGMDAARQELGKMGEGLSPERRSFMTQMMMRQQTMMMGDASKSASGGEATDKVTVKETNKTKKINGFLCRRVKVVQGKKKLIDAWVTTQIGPENYFTDIIKTLGLFKPEVITAVKKISGFPIKQKYRVQTGEFSGSLQSVEVAKIEEKKLSKDLFELPEGYKKAKEVVKDVFADDDDDESF